MFQSCALLAIVLTVFTLAGCGRTGPVIGDNPPPAASSAGAEITPPDYQRKAMRSSDIDAVTATDPLGWSLATADRRELMGLLRLERFDELGRILEAYQTSFEADPFKEDRVVDAFESFASADPSLTALLDTWVQQRPGTWPALLARATHRYNLGWYNRGKQFLSETSDQQYQGMVNAFAQARQDLEAALGVEADLALAYRLLISLEIVRGRSDEAAAALERARAASAASYWVHSAYMLRFQPRWGGSYEQLEQFVNALGPLVAANPRYRTLAGRAPAERGHTAILEDRFEEAQQAYTEALRHGPDHEYFRNRGKAFLLNGQYDEAGRDFASALALRPQDHLTIYLEAQGLAHRGQVEEARASIATARTLDPFEAKYQQWGIYLAQQLVKDGYEHYQANRFDDAIAQCSLAVSLDPTNHLAQYWRGRAHLKLNQRGPALKDFERAVGLEPTHYDSYVNIDWILAQERRADEIVAHWDRFLALQPDHADAHLEVAGTHRLRGDMESARAHLNRACKLGNQKACGYLQRM